MREHLVLIGNGMAGVRLVEEILEREIRNAMISRSPEGMLPELQSYHAVQCAAE